MNYQYTNGTFGPRVLSAVDWEPIRPFIRERISEKYSAGEIAKKILEEFKVRVSRNAVIGQIHRHKLGRLYTQAREDSCDQVITGRIRRPIVKLRPKNEIDVSCETNEDDQQIPIEQRCTLMQLNKYTCRWPCGDVMDKDFFFCGGDTVQDKPYCAGHCLRAFNYEAKNKRFKPRMKKAA